jgi:hypothetical protein
MQLLLSQVATKAFAVKILGAFGQFYGLKARRAGFLRQRRNRRLPARGSVEHHARWSFVGERSFSTFENWPRGQAGARKQMFR